MGPSVQGVAPDQLDTLVTVLDLVRSGGARTRPELARRSGLGRTVVSQRLGQLEAAGLVTEGDLGTSTGGRAPRELRFRADAGVLLVASLGVTGFDAGVADLSGRLVDHRSRAWDIATGPEASLSRVESLFDELLADRGAPAVWGVGLGVPGPVEFASGRPVAPPIMPGWDGYPVRDRLATRYDAPAFVDNEVNLMALGEYRAGRGVGSPDLVLVKIGTGIGAGLISGGRLHRGAQGSAGDIGHVGLTGSVPGAEQVVCRCGNVGCLEAFAGGAALARDATAAALDNRGEHLTERLAKAGEITSDDVVRAAEFGDRVAVELLSRAGRLVGDTVAAIVNFFNPSTILLGGRVGTSGDLLLAGVRQSVYRRSLPLATRDLQIARASLGERAGPTGAGCMVVDELFGRDLLARWIPHGSPAGMPGLHPSSRADA
ncbi:ROK family protein [Pseudonocardia alni]|uniref:Glucokinase-like ROK family protein n=1 Tax=Pseudonocardia alni TaxID=33907 RepID=A0A852VV50_PSEA5|nr:MULTISPECIES: ROK family transcriptional regulator [Pseudonocardia]MCO7192449.1 ROK family transcriptional regulator [Pseudonocardia sp. McavD-2-B]NYG00828.1 glucokinase-like ROK family protein [Pseudonocardia antarctica]PKB33418.1 glucokinase-like ROK family protein [Pseudonocardia alni]